MLDNDEELNTQDELELDTNEGEEAEVDEQEDAAEEEDEQGNQEEEKPEDNSTYIDQEFLEKNPVVKRRLQAESKRKHEDAERIRKLEQQLLEREKQQHESGKPVEVPKPHPDLAYEDREEYDRQMQAHYDSKDKVKEWESSGKNIQQKEQQFQSQQEAQAGLEIQNKFLENAAKKGVTQEQAEKIAGVVVGHLQQMQLSEQEQKKSQQLMRLVFKNESGVDLLETLSRKPDELSNLMRLPIEEASYQLGEMSRALKTRNLKSNAPPPDDPIRSTTTSDDSPFLKGARFE